MKLSLLFNALLLYVFVLLGFHYLHVRFFNVDVVFYGAIFDAMSAVLITVAIVCMSPYFSEFSVFEKLQLAIICILLGYSFSISIPTVIDRSLSFYLLEKLEQRGGGIQLESFEQVFTQEYMVEHRLVDVRLTEQLSSGTITIEDSCVKITKKGRLLTQFSRLYRQNLLPKKRLLMGEYSDDLTDPFAHSSIRSDASVDYMCN